VQRSEAGRSGLHRTWWPRNCAAKRVGRQIQARDSAPRALQCPLYVNYSPLPSVPPCHSMACPALWFPVPTAALPLALVTALWLCPPPPSKSGKPPMAPLLLTAELALVLLSSFLHSRTFYWSAPFRGSHFLSLSTLSCPPTPRGRQLAASSTG
jgi:hypothetical protein